MPAVTAYAHTNIALVKYWGKRPGAVAGLNLPAVGSISLTLDARGGLHGRGLVELGDLLGHLRRRHRVSHAQCAEADRRQRGPVPGDLDGKPVQHGSLPGRLRHQSAVESPSV